MNSGTHPKVIQDVNGVFTTRHVSNYKTANSGKRISQLGAKHAAMTPTNDLFQKAIQRTPLKEMNSSLLAAAIEYEIPSERVADAIALASLLHRHATRGSRGAQPREEYICHPLRNALRLIRLGCYDEELAVGSILHDTVEDCTDELISIEFPDLDISDWDEKRKQDFVIDSIMEPRFGERVAKILRGVTNPPLPKYMPKVEKNQHYVAHVLEVIEDEDIFLVKCKDWGDNAGSIHHHFDEKPEMVISMAKKYLPLADPFLERLKTVTQLSEESKELMRLNILEIKGRISKFAAM